MTVGRKRVKKGGTGPTEKGAFLQKKEIKPTQRKERNWGVGKGKRRDEGTKAMWEPLETEILTELGKSQGPV